MRLLLIFFLFVVFCSFAHAQIFAIVDRSIKSQPLTTQKMSFIAETLHANKPALNLDCEVKVKEIKQERKFSDGIRIVEMLEIRYRSSLLDYQEQLVFFPLQSLIKIQNKNSGFSGTVEEFELQSDDLANSRFIFQHDGRGNLIWMSFENDLKTIPCGLK